MFRLFCLNCFGLWDFKQIYIPGIFGNCDICPSHFKTALPNRGECRPQTEHQLLFFWNSATVVWMAFNAFGYAVLYAETTREDIPLEVRLPQISAMPPQL